ncbi:hypothetical protein GPECTOR_7g1076 [Gonium pectorale]|uniref:Uncharacterized protein n=1 Tax=Gonium pectorale TaxID=33097 RepID=A0A150GTS3_GONPE|nr:hypothetical protein GPECTOR_7g1076 [Gonium pectorale]|eukprot:KXZ53184.1 hypothetical protein GPECTOR_7g1076 [Gonium pectorale]
MISNKSSFPGFVAVALDQLDALTASTQGVTGYCLITDSAAAAEPQPHPSAVAQFLRPFNSLQPTVSFSALGTKLQVVSQSEGSIFALGPRRRLGLALCLLQQGVAVVTFDRSLPLPAAVTATERCAATIRTRVAIAA